MRRDDTSRPSLARLLTSPLSALARVDSGLAGMVRESLERYIHLDLEGRPALQWSELALDDTARPAKLRTARASLAVLAPIRGLALRRGRVSTTVELRRSVGGGPGSSPRFEAVPVPTADRRRVIRRGAFVEIDLEVDTAQTPEAWCRIERRLAEVIPESKP